MNRDKLTNIFFVLPSVAFYTLLVVGPLVLSIYYSFFDWDGISPHMSFIGLQNYIDGLHDYDFRHSILVTFFYTIVSGVLSNGLGLFFAIMLNKKGKLTNFYRSVFFFPMLLSAVIVGFIWQALLGYSGIINQFIAHFHMQPIQFLGRPWPAILSLTGIMIWSGVGFAIVFYLAGLQTVPSEFYEAAKIDGASSWKIFRHMTFPMIAPAVTMNVVFSIMGGLKQYDLIKVVTGGGPAKSTETMSVSVISQAFDNSHYSYGSALGVYLLLIIAVLSFITTIFLRKREENLIG